MRKGIVWPVLALVALGSMGCLDAGDRAAFYAFQQQMAANQKPIIRMVAMEGQVITLGGVQEFEVYGPGQDVQQLHDEWATVARDGMGVLGALGGIWLGGEAAVALVDSVGRTAGVHNSFQNSFNPNGNQASAGFSTGDGPLIFQPVGGNRYEGTGNGDNRDNPTDNSDRSQHNENNSQTGGGE